MAAGQPDDPANSRPDAPGGRRLDSWKEIATYLKRDVATARRWEKREALPVHRHHHEKLGSVYAFTRELDAWLEARSQTDRRPRRLVAPEPALRIGLIGALVVLLAVLAFQLRKPDASADGRQRLRLAVSRSGTVAGLIGEGLRDLFSRALPDVEVDAVEQPNMTGMLRAIDSGEADLGLAFNLLAFHAVKSDGLLGHRSGAITALTVAYQNPAQILVRRDSDIKTTADLRGKRISLGIAESAERISSELLLFHLGFKPGDFSDEALDFAPSLAKLRGHQLDAYITWRGLPVPDVGEAFGTGELRLVPLDPESIHSLRLKHPFLIPWTIPAHVYAYQDSPVPSVSARMMLVASRSLSSDLVEKMMRAMAGHMPDLVARHPAAADINLTRKPSFADGLSIDLHPGAERFFQSVSSR